MESSQVWVKLGGDKGATFQIVHIPNPNSVQNTCFQSERLNRQSSGALERYKQFTPNTILEVKKHVHV